MIWLMQDMVLHRPYLKGTKMNIQLLVNGISLGAIYALIAVGFAVIYSVLKFSNFAHGGMIGATAYIAYFFHTGINPTPPLALTVIVSALAGMVMAILIDTLAYRRIRKRNSPRIYYFVASVTVGILIESFLSATLGTNYMGFGRIFDKSSFNIGEIVFSTFDMVALLVSLVLLFALAMVINKTKIGLAIRSVAINSETSKLMGINSNTIITLCFVIAGLLAGVNGALLGIKYTVTPSLGSSMITKGFISSVIGGLGSLSGAIAGAFLLGILEMTITYFLGSNITPLLEFIVLLLFLFLRPQGIAGKIVADKV